MNRGIGQNQQTCWFYSSLNIFLLSDNGLKVLWKKLQEVYAGFSPNQKTYFNSNFNTPCPLRNARNISRTYFWKFMDEYMCSIGGPGRLPVTAQKSKEILQNFPLKGAGARESKGLAPAWPSEEIGAILKHIGFTSKEFRILSWNEDPNQTWTTPVLIYLHSETNLKRRTSPFDLPLVTGGYELTGASLSFQAQKKNVGHAVACMIRDGRGYIFDSYQPWQLRACDWPDASKLFSTMTTIYGKLDKLSYSFVVYVKKDYTNKISPSCRRAYKPLTQPNLANLRRRSEISNNIQLGGLLLSGKNNTGTFQTRITPRVRAEIIKEYAKRPVVNSKIYRFISNRTDSYQNGMNMLKSFVNRGWRYSNQSPNYINFKTKLLERYPRPAPSSMYNWAIRQRLNSKNNILKKLENFAKERNFVINKNSKNYKNLVEALNRRFSTRSATSKTRVANK